MQKTNQLKLAPKKKAALIISGIFLFLILLEISLRLGGWILLSVQEQRNRQSIRQKGAYRILCLGESTTQGEYPPFLERALNQHNLGIRFSVIDKGRSGTRSPAILSQVESYLNEYRPDMVVAMMGINDSGEYVPLERSAVSKGMLLIRSLRTYKLIRILWFRILAKAEEAGICRAGEDRQVAIGVPAGVKDGFTVPAFSENALKQIIASNPANDNAYVDLGWFYKVQDKYSLAEECLKKAIALNPNNDKAYVYLGHFYRNQGKYPQAEECLRKAVALTPKNDIAYVELGWLYKIQGKCFQAEESFKKAIELNPKNDNTYVELGRLYRNQGKYAQAEESFKKAIGLNPKNDRTYGIIAGLYKESGKLSLAKEYTEKAGRLRLEYCMPVTVNSYRKLKEILDRRRIKFVCVQYPMRSLDVLRNMFGNDAEGIIFVDNENTFKEALKRANREEYFVDMFAGDFGHCTEKGNKLLAQQIADVISRGVFNK